MYKENRGIMSDEILQITDEEALSFHTTGKPGKIEIVPTKPADDTTRFVAGLFAWRRGALPCHRRRSGYSLRLYRQG